MRDIKYIVIHCTGAPASQTTTAIKAYWKAIGWKNVGYHKLISADGSFETLATDDKVTNGVKGYNTNSIHICYKGGVIEGKPADTRTPAQKSTLETLVKEYATKYPNAEIKGHRDFPNVAKACPSFSVAEWLGEIGI
jgi:N-acetylmuramoyl-L-alanine amidase